MSAKYKSPSFLLPNELNTSANPANDTGVNSMYSMDFDGSSDYINLGDSNSLSFGNGSTDSPFSISAWIYMNDATNFRILNKYNAPNYEYQFDLSSSDKLQFYIFDGSDYRGVGYDSALSINQWYHVAATYDGRGGSSAQSGMVLYVNGLPVNDITYSSGSYTAMHNTAAPVNIGKIASSYANGQIDEVAIFNRALNTTEIAALYGGTSPNIYPSNLMASNLNPIAYYPLGEQAQMQGYLGNEASSEWQFPNGVLQDYVMDFDGTDYIDAGSVSLNSNTGAVSAWIKTSYTSDFQIITSIDNQLQCRVLTTGEIRVILYHGGSFTSLDSTSTVNDGNWHNVTFTYSSSGMKIYIDGSLNVSNTVNVTPLTTATDNFLIGVRSLSNVLSKYFNGKISNVAIWNTDQSSNIANIYNNGSPQTNYTVTPQNWWKLNADSVYTPSAPNYTTALDFDGGATTNINVGNMTVIQGASTFSIAAWINVDSTGQQRIFGSWEAGANKRLAGLGIHTNNTLLLQISSDGSAFDQLFSTSTIASTNTWYYVAVTFSNGTAEFYINGASAGADTSSITSIYNVSNNYFIGSFQASSSIAFDGSISNVAVYNSALTSSQISTLFNFGTPETNISFSPTAWWKLDNTTTGIQDSSGNGNNGTNNGATQVSNSVAVVPSWKIPSALPIPTINTTSAINIGTAGTNPGPIGLNPYFDFDLSSVTTTSIWIKTPSSSTAAQTLGTILGNNGTSGGATSSSTILLALKNDGGSGNAYIETYDYGYLGNKITSNSYSIANFWRSKWHHILMIRNNQNVSFFIDGVAAGGGAFASSQSTTPVNVNAIGGALGNWYFKDGEISNLAIWNSDQSSNVSNIYNSGQPQSSYTVTPDHLFTLDNLTTGINDVYSSSAGTAASGVTKVDSNVYVGNIPVNGVSTTLPSTALQQSDLQFDSPYSNYSLSFDGTGDYIDFGTNPSIEINGDISISSWIYVTAGSAFQGIVTKRGTSTNYQFYTDNSAIPKLRFWDGAGVSSIGTLSLNTWHHAVVTVNSGVTNGLTFYIDGIASGTGTATIVSNTDNLTIGSISGGNFFNGNIDETSIFNYSLSEAQVLEIYNNGRPNDLTTFSGTAPISWWRLGENAYFDNNSFIVPNSISGAPNGTGSGTITTMISADAPGTYANGIGANLDILDRVGDAPLSTANSQSYNIIPSDISPYVPAYVGLQTDNIYSMSFDGANSTYFNAGQSLNIYGSQPRTISCWFNINSFATTPSGDGSHLLGYGTATTSQAFSLAISKYPSNPTHRLFLHVYNSANDISGTTQILENNWYLATVTYDGSTLKLYLNGNLQGSSSTSGLNTATSDFIIGQGVFSTWNTLNGQIDEVAIWDTPLNAGQIFNDLYQPTATATNKTADLVNNPNLPNPVAWYRMGD